MTDAHRMLASFNDVKKLIDISCLLEYSISSKLILVSNPTLSLYQLQPYPYIHSNLILISTPTLSLYQLQPYPYIHSNLILIST